MKLDLPVVLTPTRVELSARCQRRHVLNDVLEYGKEKNVAAAFGNVLHSGVGALHTALEFRNLAMPQALTAGQTALLHEYEAQGLSGKDERYPIEKAYSMFEAYANQYQRVGPLTALPTTWNVLTVEDRVRLKVGDYILSFQIDRAYHSSELNKIAVIDLKTVTRPDARWKSQWYKSVQMKLYSYGAKQTYEVEDVEFVIEGLDKNAKAKVHYVSLPQWSNESLAEAVELFKRKAGADRQLIESAMNAEGEVDLAKLEHLALNETDYNYQDCYSYGAACAYLPLCESDPEYRRGLLHADYHQIEADY